VTCHARGRHRETEDTATEIVHEDVETLRRFGAASLTVVFELPLSDVMVVDGEKAVLDCRVAVTHAAEVTWYVDTSFTVRRLSRRTVPRSRSRSTTHSFRGHLMTYRLCRGDLSKCPT